MCIDDNNNINNNNNNKEDSDHADVLRRALARGPMWHRAEAKRPQAREYEATEPTQTGVGDDI